MQFPGYLLNPGDLFQVEPERVMYATGAPKNKYERREGRLEKRTASKDETTSESGDADTAKSTENKEVEEESKTVESPKETLKRLLAQAKTIMSREKDVLPAKKKQELRGFQKVVRGVLSKSATSTILADSLETQFSELLGLLKAKRADSASADRDNRGKRDSSTVNAESDKSVESTKKSSSSNTVSEELRDAFQQAAEDPASVDVSELSDEELEILKQAVVQMRDNPIDNSKPYATPWRPRDFMNAFAFIPRYLEVNHKICAAVYLRHPVARPGYSEVPSPFGESIQTPAFAWYLRRR